MGALRAARAGVGALCVGARTDFSTVWVTTFFDRYLPLDLYDPSCGLRSRSFHYLLHRDFLYDLDDLDLAAAAGGQKDRQDGHHSRAGRANGQGGSPISGRSRR